MTKMEKLSRFELCFVTKKDLWDRVIDLHNEMVSLQSCYKTQLERNEVQNKEINELKARVSELEGVCNGLIKNYQEVTSNLNNIFGVEDIDPSKENQAKNERNNFAQAIAEVFDWGDVEEQGKITRN